MRPLAPVVFVSLSLVLSSTLALAVGTRTFELDTLEKLSGGDLKGVSIGSDGVVRAGLSLSDVTLPDATATWSAVELADHSVLIGTTGGKVFRVAGGIASVYAETNTQAVTSLLVGA